MTTEELRRLFETTVKRSNELRAKYESGVQMSRGDCLQIRECVKRLRAIATELWILEGKPGGSEFDMLRNPPQWQPFPWSPKPLDLTGEEERGSIQ